MTSNENGIVERLAALSLERCVVRLSKVSAGTWQLGETAGLSGGIEDAIGQYDFGARPAAAVHMAIKGDHPLTSLMLFDPGSLDLVSKCFLGYSFPRENGISLSEEVMLQELGNIVLNSLSNSVFNALGVSFMPSVPVFVAGDAARIAAGVRAAAGAGETFHIVSSSLVIKCDIRASISRVIALLPAEVTRALEQSRG